MDRAGIAQSKHRPPRRHAVEQILVAVRDERLF
jgi:hypothetical protein